MVKKDVNIVNTTPEDEAYNSLLQIIRPIPSLDEDKELEEYSYYSRVIPHCDAKGELAFHGKPLHRFAVPLPFQGRH